MEFAELCQAIHDMRWRIMSRSMDRGGIAFFGLAFKHR
jgi:hypothetical protein